MFLVKTPILNLLNLGLCGGTDDNRRAEYILTKSAKANQKYNFMLEVSCTGMFGNPGAKGIKIRRNTSYSYISMLYSLIFKTITI